MRLESPSLRKRAVVASWLSLLSPFVGIMGAGHFYARYLWRGTVLLALGWVCLFLWLLFLLASGTVVGDTNATIFLVLALFALIAYGALWAWQTQDIRRLLVPRRPQATSSELTLASEQAKPEDSGSEMPQSVSEERPPVACSQDAGATEDE